MTNMRAKMRVASVEKFETCERLKFSAVCASSYPADGSDENNTYAKFTPQASVDITITNPALLDQFEAGKVYYVEFIPAE